MIYVPLEHEPEVTQEVCASSTPPCFISEYSFQPHPYRVSLSVPFILNALSATDLIVLSSPFPALGYLYSPVSLNLIRPDNSRGVLAAGCLLGGMQDLCEYAYEVCRQSITQTTISEWLEFVEMVSCAPSQNGSASPSVNMQSITSVTNVFGPYAQRLRHDVLEYLVVTLPTALNVQQRAPANGSVSPSPESPSSPSQYGSGRDVLLDIFSRVPFDLFKTAVESPTFQIGECFLTTCFVTSQLRTHDHELITPSNSVRQVRTTLVSSLLKMR